MSLNLLNQSNNSYLELLDWHLIVGSISNLSHFAITRDKFNAPINYRTPAEIQFEYDSIDFFLADAESIAELSKRVVTDLPDHTERFEVIDLLSKGKIATIDELNFIARIFESYKEVYKSFRSWGEFPCYELEQSHFQKIFSHFVNKFRAFVDSTGEINYKKHPQLGKLLDQVTDLERGLRGNISKIARSESYDKKLQYSEHDLISDRFVLAVRSDSYKADLGPIIARSGSGMTLFVEPRELRESSNKRLRLLAQIEEIIAKIARDFSETLHQYAPDVLRVKSFLLRLDELQAKAFYSIANELNRPNLSDEFKFELWDFHHPLIENPVKNNLFLKPDHKGFILSGPNTGGKTVCLKSIAICQLFMHAGLFLPVREANIYPATNIFYFSSDQQNLEEGLSSFASETINYLNMFGSFGDSNVIIVDEIFNSTSSEEASALAISFLEEIHRCSNSKVFISTHHQVFKTFIHSEDEYLSAHVGHDRETNRPTYKIFVGEPGSSMAFSIFENIAASLGLPDRISDRARQILDKKHVSYELLLQELSAQKSELDRLLTENKSINEHLKNQKKSAEGLALLEKQKMIDKYKKKVDRIVGEAETIVKNAKSGTYGSERSLRKATSKVSSAITAEQSNLQHKRPTSNKHSDLIPDIKTISVGNRFYSTLLEKEVEITAVNVRRKEVQVGHKHINLKCPVSSLRVPLNETNKQKQSREVVVNVNREIIGKVEIDCRGMRLEEFKAIVDSSVTELINGDIPFLGIIHGHGDGILKKWLRKHLATIDEITFGPEEGNDGCTKVNLKK